MQSANVTPRTIEGDEAEPLPANVESPLGKLVVLYLRTNGETSVTRLAGALRVSKLSLFPTLETLEARGVVESDGQRYDA